MSGVDVLAVLDEAARFTRSTKVERPLLKARAAVAELIEAAGDVQAASAAIEDAKGEYCPVKVPMDVQSNLNRALFAAQDRFDAALRRVKGESE